MLIVSFPVNVFSSSCQFRLLFPVKLHNILQLNPVNNASFGECIYAGVSKRSKSYSGFCLRIQDG